MACTCFNKRNKPDVLEVVMQQAFIAVQGRRLSRRVEASGYGMTHTALLRNLKKKKKYIYIYIRRGNYCNWANVFSSFYTSQ